MALLCLLAGACRTPVPSTLDAHMLSVDPSGHSYSDPSADSPPLGFFSRAKPRATCDSQGLDRQVNAIMRGLEEHLDAGGAPEIMLFLHGGLVSMPQSFDEAKGALKLLEEEDVYPIFVSWNTGILSSYSDYLFRVRSGRNVPIAAGIATSPLLLFSDLARAIGRTPLYLWRQTKTLFAENGTEAPPESWSTASLDDAPKSRSFLDYVSEFIPGSARLLTTPLLDMIGDSAYQNMLRRTRVLFQLDGDFDGGERLECGALSRLTHRVRELELHRKGRIAEGGRNRGLDPVTVLRSLQIERQALVGEGADLVDWLKLTSEIDATSRELEGSKDCKRQAVGEQKAQPCVIRITIIAHSMGAIVANELLHRNGDLYFSDVVYMAAASSIKDFAELALPYLKANPTTTFYNLTLHPVADRRESNGWNAIPRGSLLDWLDRFLNDSKSELDRTLGSWNNISRALPVIDYLENETRARLIVRGFGMRPGQPQRHGEFNDPPLDPAPDDPDDYPGARFWRRDFWEGHTDAVETAADAPSL